MVLILCSTNKPYSLCFNNASILRDMVERFSYRFKHSLFLNVNSGTNFFVKKNNNRNFKNNVVIYQYKNFEIKVMLNIIEF